MVCYCNGIVSEEFNKYCCRNDIICVFDIVEEIDVFNFIGSVVEIGCIIVGFVVIIVKCIFIYNIF